VSIRLGINPLSWTIDDLPEVGGETPLETCLREARAAGFEGVELGCKFPRTAPELRTALAPYGLALVSGWYSTNLLLRDAAAEFEAMRPHRELLADLGCEVVGPAPNMAAARELAESDGPIDAAMMDVHIRGDVVFALCEVLAARGVPFVLTSGYADWQMPDKWEDRPRLQKPYTIDQVEEALAQLIGA